MILIFFLTIVSSFGDNFFSLEAPCMETMLSDFYLAGVHCLGIMNKNSKCTKNMPGISGGERARKDIALFNALTLQLYL